MTRPLVNYAKAGIWLGTGLGFILALSKHDPSLVGGFNFTLRETLLTIAVLAMCAMAMIESEYWVEENK